MPDLSLLLGAAIFASGMLAGRFWPARRKGRKPPKPVKPICGCGHDLAHHEPDGGGSGIACHAGVQGEITKWDQDGFPIGWEIAPCACQQYTGPRILDPGYLAREITDA